MFIGLVGDIIEYHAIRKEYEDALHMASHEFLDSEECWKEMTEGDLIAFNEWLVFDFVLPNGKNLIENYLEKNVDKMINKKVDACRDMLDNTYSLFKVLDVTKGIDLKLYDVIFDKEYSVLEKKGSTQLHKEDAIFCRVGKVGDYWEIMSGKVHIFPFVINKEMLHMFRDIKEPINMKYLYSHLIKEKYEGGGVRHIEKKEAPKEAVKRMERFLAKHGLDSFMAVLLIQQWIYAFGTKDAVFKDSNQLTAVLYGLMNTDSKKDVEEMMEVVTALCNSSPMEKLNGLSPNEKRVTQEGAPKFTISRTPLFTEGFEYFVNAMPVMGRGEYKKAEKMQCKGFEKVLKDRYVFSDPYRMFCNLAVCCFAQNLIVEGEKFLEIALELNPNYGFATKIAHKHGEYMEDWTEKEQKQLEKMRKDLRGYIAKHPAIKYYEFLKKTGINFATKTATVDKPFTLNNKEEGEVGRNDPCHCGSGLKYKKCHGK